MKERVFNFWNAVPQGAALALPTSGYVAKNGRAVFARGILAQAKHQYKDIDRVLGRKLIGQGRVPGHRGKDLGVGNHVTALWLRPPVFSFPIKWNFWEDADLSLIERSARELVEMVDSVRLARVYLPPVGDGHPWPEVRSILERYMDNRFVVVHEP